MIQCDAQIHRIDSYNPNDLPREMRAVGRGGTDFRPVFEHIESETRPPAVLIYMTDMLGVWPEEEPSFPTIWVSTGSPGSYHKRECEWGDTIYMHADEGGHA